MADLEAAADAALLKVKEFQDHVAKAHDAFTALGEELARLTGQVESDWTALTGAVKTFLETAEAQRAAFDQEGREAAEALSGLPGAIGGAQAEGEQELQGARGELLGFGQRVEAARPAITAMGEDVHVLAESVTERAHQVEAQLNEALSEARDFLGVQVVEDLKGIEEAIRQRAANLESRVTEECLQALEDCYGDFEAKVTELEQLIQDKAFAEAEDHVREVVEYSVGECRQGHNAVLDTLAGNVRVIEDDLQRIEQSIDQRRADVDADKDALEGEVALTEDLVAAMHAALTAVRELMASYTFVEF